jgi:hypothetical protein
VRCYRHPPTARRREHAKREHIDDAQGEPVEFGEVGAVGQWGQDVGAAAAGDTDQEVGAGAGDGFQEVVAVEAAVGQDQHVGGEQVQQPGCVSGFTAVAGASEPGAEQATGAGLDQGHQQQLRVWGGSVRVPGLTQPAPAGAGVRGFERPAAVERDRP